MDLGVMHDDDQTLPEGNLAGMPLYGKDAFADYLAGRRRDRQEVGLYLAEARRRAERRDTRPHHCHPPRQPPQETTQRHTVLLKEPNQQVEVCTVKF
jgi:hypothetical protein